MKRPKRFPTVRRSLDSCTGRRNKADMYRRFQIKSGQSFIEAYHDAIIGLHTSSDVYPTPLCCMATTHLIMTCDLTNHEHASYIADLYESLQAQHTEYSRIVNISRSIIAPWHQQQSKILLVGTPLASSLSPLFKVVLTNTMSTRS